MGKIEGNEVFSESLIKAPLELNKNIEVLLKTVERLIVGLKKAESTMAESKGSKQVNEANKKRKKTLTELEKVEKSIQKSREKSTRQFIQQKAALDKLNQETRESVKDVNAQNDAYKRLDRQLTKSRNAYKNLAAAGKANTKEAKALKNEVNRLDGQLKKIDASVGQNQRSVGKYSNAVKGIAARFIGWTAAIALVSRALKSGFNAVRDNSKANAELRGILNKTREETIELRKEQLRLGSATVFTATQVTKAQTELSRLGLSMEEIIELTPAVLDGAIAMGVDLAEAAELVAGQLNAFGLAAKDGQRVTDVLVRSTQISAFNFTKLKDALRVVSPAANAVGDSVEDVVSKLTAAVDANIEASTASTALRNIYIELAKSGLTWDEAMTKINTSTNKLSTANDLFGKRGAVVAIALADNTEKINENKIALDGAAGSAEAFAKAQRDNLSGDQLIWTSAWEGFFQQLNEGNSLISEFTRGTIQAFTAAMQAMTRAMAGTNLEAVLWEERIKTMDLSLEELGDLANRSADEITTLKNTIANTGVLHEFKQATDDLVEAEKRRVFILDLLKQKIKASIPVVVEETEVIDDNTDAVEENVIALKELKSLVAELPGEFTDFQLGLFAITDRLFGKNTIDDDAKEFLKKTGATIDKVGELSKAAREKEIEEAQLLADTKAEIVDQSIEATQQILADFTALRIQQIGQELEFIEFSRDRELEKVKGNKRAEEAVNADFDRKKRELEKKQLNAQKADSLFQIAIATAVSIAKVSPNPILIALAAAIGASQAAVVLAQQVPQFDKGSESTPKDYIAGEKRPELRKSGGKWSLVDKPTLFGNSPGDTIIGGSETDNILGKLADLSGPNLLSNTNFMGGLESRKERNANALVNEILRSNKSLERTIKNKPSANISVSRSRMDVKEKHGNTWVNRLDARYKGRV